MGEKIIEVARSALLGHFIIVNMYRGLIDGIWPPEDEEEEAKHVLTVGRSRFSGDNIILARIEDMQPFVGCHLIAAHADLTSFWEFMHTNWSGGLGAKPWDSSSIQSTIE